MHSASSILFFAASAALVGAQSFPDETALPGCGQTCFTNMLAESTALGCTDESASCLCAIADFTNGLIGCANGACAADLVPSVTSYLYSVCYTATQYASATTSATTTYATTAVASTTTSAAYVDTTSTSATHSSNGTYTGVAGILPTTSASSTTLKSSTTKATSTASSTSASASATSTAAASTLSAGAKAGIGIGSAVGAVAVIAGLVALYLMRKHGNHRAPPGAIEISDPLPGAGRVYANEHDNSSELEMKSRRYEDMVPRQVPRTMV